MINKCEYEILEKCIFAKEDDECNCRCCRYCNDKNCVKRCGIIDINFRG